MKQALIQIGFIVIAMVYYVHIHPMLSRFVSRIHSNNTWNRYRIQDKINSKKK